MFQTATLRRSHEFELLSLSLPLRQIDSLAQDTPVPFQPCSLALIATVECLLTDE